MARIPSRCSRPARRFVAPPAACCAPRRSSAAAGGSTVILSRSSASGPTRQNGTRSVPQEGPEGAPDVNDYSGGRRGVRKIQGAYDTLSDPDRRRAWERAKRSGAPPPRGGGGAGRRRATSLDQGARRIRTGRVRRRATRRRLRLRRRGRRLLGVYLWRFTKGCRFKPKGTIRAAVSDCWMCSGDRGFINKHGVCYGEGVGRRSRRRAARDRLEKMLATTSFRTWRRPRPKKSGARRQVAGCGCFA